MTAKLSMAAGTFAIFRKHSWPTPVRGKNLHHCQAAWAGSIPWVGPTHVDAYEDVDVEHNLSVCSAEEEAAKLTALDLDSWQI
jgi:hypothetical protein